MVMGTRMHSCSTGSAPCLWTREEAVKNFPLSHFCLWNPLGLRAHWGSRIPDAKVAVKKVHLFSPGNDGEKQIPDLSQLLSLGEDDPSILCCCNGDQETPSQESSHLSAMEKSCCPSSRLLLNVLGTEAKHFPYPGSLFFHQQNETSNLGKKTQLALKKKVPTKKKKRKNPIIFLN